MNKHLSFRIHPLLLAAIIVAGVFAMLLTAYAIFRNSSEGEVMGRVAVAGTEIGGLSRDEALSAVLGVENEYQARQAVFTIDGTSVTVDPPVTGFDLDEKRIVDEAMLLGRQGNGAYQFLWWIQHLFSSEEVEVVGSVSEAALNDLYDSWDEDVIGQPATLGAIVLNDGVPQPVYPNSGVGMDRDASTSIIEASLLADQTSPAVLPTRTIVPKLSDADIDAALLEANQLLAEPITMVYNGSQVVFTPEQLTEAYLSETIAEGSPQVVHYFDPAIIDKYLDPVRADYEAEPIDAQFLISGDAIVISPGRRGTRIDETETALKLVQAGQTDSRLGQLPLVEDADPDVTTEYLESLQINHLVSSFTTYHSCCQNRVVNIQTMADTIDGHIVMPGEEFSINAFVGQRTPEKGYLPAGTIVAGELVDTVGGGVSQFATTIYNAIFWAGLEDIDHKPHSYYFSRYPEGIEATVNWQTPNLIFRNDTQGAIMIDTEHTDNSITVRIFGNNDGRTVKGEQTGGKTQLNVVAEGGPNAIHIEADVSDRYALTSPRAPKYKANAELEVDEQIQTQEERGGWSVTVIRRKVLGGVRLIAEQEWVVRYLPTFAVFEVHPCMVDQDATDCPVPTTTTTVPPSTTTTTVPPSTTTTTEGG